MALKPAQIALELSHPSSTITRELNRPGGIQNARNGILKKKLNEYDNNSSFELLHSGICHPPS